MIKVNIVIPTYNGLKFLEPLYQSLRAGISDKIDWRLTLVDDGSTDSTARWAKGHSDINYLKQLVNLGFAKACNLGAKNLDSEYILFLNNDTEPKKGFLEAMLRVAESFPFPGIVGAKLIFPDKKTVQTTGIRFMASGYPFEDGHGKDVDDPDISRTTERDGVTAAAMLVKKDLFDLVGGFCEEYVNGWEDSHFCLEAKELGTKIFYCADAEIIHHRFGSDGRFVHERDNKALFKDKWITHRNINILSPFWMAIAVTWRCNLRCKHCNIWKREPTEDINVHIFQRYIAPEFFNNITNVCIFGGESTLHPQLADFLVICNDRWPDQEIGIATNGTMPELQKKFWTSIAEKTKINIMVCISIDGRKAMHDKLRGGPGIFDQAVETSKHINQLWPGKGKISITVYPESVNELPFLIEFVEKLGLTFFVRLGVSGSYFGGKVEEEWTPEKIALLDKLINQTPSELFAHDRFAKRIPQFLKTGEHRKCDAFRKSLVVNTDFQTSICHELKPLCHLRDIPAIWGRSAEWCQLGVDCCTDKCWRTSCEIDGPAGLSYIYD